MGKTTLKKIRIIEEPKSEELLQQELEEALAGFSCGSYSSTGCTAFFSTSNCKADTSSEDYCGKWD